MEAEAKYYGKNLYTYYNYYITTNSNGDKVEKRYHEYTPKLDNSNGKLLVGLYGNSNLGSFKMISLEVKDFLQYADGQDILKEIYEKKVNETLKKDYSNTFYNNQEFNKEYTLNKFKEVEKYITLPLETLEKDKIKKEFIYKLKDEYEKYVYTSNTSKNSFEYKAKNKLFDNIDKRVYPKEVKKALKNSYIFEKMIEFSKKENIEKPENLRYKDNFEKLVEIYSKEYSKESMLENNSKKNNDKFNYSWSEKINTNKSNDMER